MLDGSNPARTLIAEGLAVAPGAKPVDWCGPVTQEADGVARIVMLSAGG
jgi:hypothetical protein